MIKFSMLIISLIFTPFFASAHNFTDQQRVNPVGVSDKGELIYENQQFSYKPWNSASLVGKVRVVQHIAGRTSAKEMNAPLVEAIKAAKLPHEYYQTTTIVNTDDAIIGTSVFVRNSIEDSKKEFPWSQFIVDSNGSVKKAWGLDDNGSAVVVLDAEGKIRFAKDGALTPQEVQQVIAMLHQLLKEKR